MASTTTYADASIIVSLTAPSGIAANVVLISAITADLNLLHGFRAGLVGRPQTAKSPSSQT